ncbi:MAG: hypothetical protein ACRCUM_01310 [Mycoplasmoidaceae bacterium]
MNRDFNDFLSNYLNENINEKYLILFEEEIEQIKMNIDFEKMPARLNDFLEIDNEMMNIFIETFLEKKNVKIENKFVVVPSNYVKAITTYLNDNTPKDVLNLFNNNFKNRLKLLNSWSEQEKNSQ